MSIRRSAKHDWKNKQTKHIYKTTYICKNTNADIKEMVSAK